MTTSETPDKETEIIPFTSLHPGTEFKLADLPEEVWLEGLDKGLASLTLDIHGLNSALFTDMALPNGGAIASTNDSDTVQLGVGIGLTAYRPMHPPGGYAPFQKTAVAEADETDQKRGPGIRINNDDDNNNDNPDRLDDNQVNPQENDLIEMTVDGLPGQDLRLQVADPNLVVWADWSKGTEPLYRSEIPGDFSETIVSGTTVYVEWTGDYHLLATNILLYDFSSGAPQFIDSITFHTFQGISIGLSGEDVSGSSNYLGSGMYTVAKELYASGFDAYFFDEDNVDTVGSGAVFDEIKAAVGTTVSSLPDYEFGRFVAHVGLYGHSHGGGSIADLAELMFNLRGLLKPLTIDITGYVDAIGQTGIHGEGRYPIFSQYHANYYQDINLPSGKPVGGAHLNVDVNTDRGWKDEEGNPLTHSTIDDSLDLHEELLDLFEQHMTR